MNKFVEQIIDEAFKSKAQQGLFYAKAKKSKKWAKMAKEFSDKTDWDKKLPYKVKKSKKKQAEEMTTDPLEVQTNVDEIVDADGNIRRGDEPGNPNQYITAKKTTDQVAKTTMGMMGSFGVLGGMMRPNATLKYWAEADISKGLGAEVIDDPNMTYDKAVDYLENDLEVPEDEAEERVEKMGFDSELPEGKIRLIENPKKYIEEYLAQKSRDNELVKKDAQETAKRDINPILQRQLGTLKQTLKDNGLSIKDIAQYLEDNE